MKRSIILLLFAFGVANAQKGSVLVQGSVGYTNQTQHYPNGDVKADQFNFDPQIGYQFAANWTAGIECSIYNNTNQNFSGNGNGINEVKVNGYSAGAFVRYTKPLTDMFSFYADLGGGFVSIKRTDFIQSNFILPGNFITTQSTSTGDGFYAALTPALFINIKNGFGLNFNIGGLEYAKVNYGPDLPDFSTFIVNFGRTVNIGVSKNFSFNSPNKQ